MPFMKINGVFKFDSTTSYPHVWQRDALNQELANLLLLLVVSALQRPDHLTDSTLSFIFRPPVIEWEFWFFLST